MDIAQQTNSFTAYWDNKFIDDDGVYGNQCWDEVSMFVKALGCPSLPTRPGGNGGAKDCYEYFLNPLPQFFDKIEYTSDLKMQKGDIVIWGAKVGIWGHIAIFNHYENGGFVSFDQNWPVNSKCHFQWHNYYGVIGILRFKKGAAMEKANLDQARQIVFAFEGADGYFNSKNALTGALDGELNKYIVGKKTLAQALADTYDSPTAHDFRERWYPAMIAAARAGGDAAKKLAELNNKMGELNAEIAGLKSRPTKEELATVLQKAEEAQKLANDLVVKNQLLEAEKTKADETGRSFMQWLGGILNSLKK